MAVGIKVKLPPNMVGKDYVVGDLHGDYDSLMRLMEFVNFNKGLDRLFCVGDLIHRGNKSDECLKLLTTSRPNGEKWFYSTIGNHDVFDDQELPQFSKYNVNYKPYEKEMRSLPFMYQVEHPIFGHYWVTHGELDSNILFGSGMDKIQVSRNMNADLEIYRNITKNAEYKVTKQDQMNAQLIEGDLTFAIKEALTNDNWAPSPNLIFNSIWGRSLFTYFFYSHHKQIVNNDFSFLKDNYQRASKLKIFCGHNLVPFPIMIGHQIYCDTGACFGYDEKSFDILKGFSLWGSQFFGLSMIDVNMGTVYTCVSSANSLVLPDNKHTGNQYKRGDIVKLNEPLYPNVFEHK